MKYDTENSVLDPTRDAMLIQNIEQYAEAAGLAGNPHFIWQSILKKKYATAKERKLFNNLDKIIEKRGRYGAYWTRETYKPAKKFMAFTGLLVRNYINSFFITLPELSQMLMKDEHPVHKVVFIPDFFIHHTKSKTKSKDIPDWKKDMLYSFLQRRISNGFLTFMYISDEKQFEEAYGTEMLKLIEQNFGDMGQGYDE